MGNESLSALRFNASGREELSSSTKPLNIIHVEYGDMTRRFPHAPAIFCSRVEGAIYIEMYVISKHFNEY
jgi:hypothetical protein